jgi:hypothetical protein
MSIVDDLEHYARKAMPHYPNDICSLAKDEIERLQRIIDSRPAINAGLPETYIKWSQSIYEMEFARATQLAGH